MASEMPRLQLKALFGCSNLFLSSFDEYKNTAYSPPALCNQQNSLSEVVQTALQIQLAAEYGLAHTSLWKNEILVANRIMMHLWTGVVHGALEELSSQESQSCDGAHEKPRDQKGHLSR